jgi:hypothetical protein
MTMQKNVYRGEKKSQQLVLPRQVYNSLLDVSEDTYVKENMQHEWVLVHLFILLQAVLEYLSAEILELAGNAARDNKKACIVPRHITLFM